MDGASFKKGRVLSGDDLERLRKAGIDTVVARRLEAGDIGEDEAAARVARALTGETCPPRPPSPAAVNLFADAARADGYDRDLLEPPEPRSTRRSPWPTLPPYAPVEPRQMVATIKIIPFAVPGKRWTPAST